MKKKFIVLGVFGLILLFYFLFYVTSINIKFNENQGIVSLNFDDGLKSQYNIAFKEMQKYNYKGTLFLIAKLKSFEGKELMSFREAREMQNNGWEIGSHTLHHPNLTMLSNEEMREELKKSKEILENEGFEIKTIAFPYGEYNRKVIDETKKYYAAARPVKGWFNSIKNPDTYSLNGKGVLRKHASEEVCSWIEKANKQGLWLILVFHGIGKEKTLYDFSEQKFKEVLECISKQGIEVKTMADVIEDVK